MDLASIGFRADTRDLDKAEKKLDKLSSTGAKTEKKIGGLESRFKSFGRNASAAAATVSGPLGGISSRISSLTTVATAGGAAMTAFAVAVTAASFAIVKGVRELDKLEVSLARSNALIKATGSAAGKTGEQLAAQAQEIAFSTLASVEGISKAQSIMLTFKNVSGDAFDDAIRLSQDMASVMGGDASTAALQLGKALNDPILGMTALSRAGIQFTDQQKDQAKSLIESGQLLEAQAVILDEVKGQLSGVAESIAGATLSGSLDTFGQSFDNLTVRIAENVNALDTFKYVIDRIGSGMRATTQQLAPDTASEAADKAINLIWAIADAEAKAGKMTNSIQKDIQNTIVTRLKEERQAYLDYAATASDAENKVITARGDAILQSIKLREESEKAAAQAKKLADAAPFEKWKKSIEEFQTPLQKLQSELDKINKGIAGGDISITGGVPAYIESLTDKMAALNEKAKDTSYQDWINGIESSTGKLQSLQDEIVDIWLAMDAGDISGKSGLEAIDQIEDKIKGLKKTVEKSDVFGGMTESITDSLQAMQGFTSQGSKEYAKLGVAIQAVNAIQAIGAVINQGQGDPYSAFGRMAAMAASMAALGQSVGGLGGSLEDQSATNQANQGLNVWGDKSESISNSIDITADATDKLVGINTGMLKALQSLQAGISGAAGITARGASGANFNFQADVNPNIYKNVANAQSKGFTTVFGESIGSLIASMHNTIPSFIGKLFGGSSSVVDSGVKILGGTFEDIINGASVYAFRQTESKKYRWSSTKTNNELRMLDDASTQFTLVFSSLADSVFEGATSLGLAGDSVEDAINSFQLATTKISLKGLSVDAQQEAIEAVFSKIFDNLSGAVVPFLKDFQQTGEGLGETLARLSTEVAVADFAVKNLVVNLGDKLANPEMYAKIADNLSMMVGGVDEFANKTASFTDKFAPDSVKFSIASNALTSQLEAVGLAVPSSTDAFFALMQSIDGTTAAGQKQIATLLDSQDVADSYYDQLEDLNSSLTSLSESLRGTIDSIYGVDYATSQLSLTAALEAARLGDFSKALELNLSNVAPSANDFGSIAAFNVEQAVTANKLDELANLASGTITVQDMTLTANQEQVALLTSINTSMGGAYIPQQTQVQNNDTMIIELKAIREELELIKYADTATAKSTAKSANHLQNIEYDGLEVRIEA